MNRVGTNKLLGIIVSKFNEARAVNDGPLMLKYRGRLNRLSFVQQLRTIAPLTEAAELEAIVSATDRLLLCASAPTPATDVLMSIKSSFKYG